MTSVRDRMKQVKQFILFHLRGQKPKPEVPLRPGGIKETICPKEFLKEHPGWDDRPFDKITYI